ncbi:AraC-type DNA-binding protein [Micromonospora phaseoli]|uniref:AraC-type DNA-binding protein n=1 Tax=Micromonospora phaseoli TaxID=1144548 RepID=A0A1H6RGP7_9ACTN|nr:AraC family transcriptional regulator [Micromonospora phaseoli]GIJ78386.1 HTH-type transcriptional activator RhaR [Micromonospora phaseoli]SEI50352.1 AraC-type DNA-binding protein [Micromonospora phaseoli]
MAEIRQSLAGDAYWSQARSPVPVAFFDRAPGAPAVAIARVTDDTPTGKTGAHSHDFLVLFYAHRGSGTVLIDEAVWTVNEGDIFIIAPGQVVSAIDPHRKLVIDGWVVWFPTDVIRPGTGGPYSSWRTHPLLFPFALGVERAQRLRIPASGRAEWWQRFVAIDAELRGRRDGYHEATHALLTLLLVDLSRLTTDITDTLRARDEPLLAAVFDAIERRYHEPISLAQIAAELALSPGHLTTVVRRKTGRTVQQWITLRRMQQARLLLTDTDLTIATISRRIGYPDTSYFIKRFRTDHEMTPAQWRSAALPDSRTID